MSRLSIITKPAAYQLVPPGRILRRELEARALTVRAFADALGSSASRISAILSARSPISPEIAVRLSAYFGNSAQFWLNLQSAYDLAVFERDEGEALRRRIKRAA